MPTSSTDIAAMKDCIASLLERIDAMVAAPPCHLEVDGVKILDKGGHSLHSFGMTPTWYIEAAHLATYGKPYSAPHSKEGD